MLERYAYKSYKVILKVIYTWIIEYFRLLCWSIGYIQSNEEICGEDIGNTCVRKDFMLTAKTIPLCGGRDKRIIKYGLFNHSRTYGKTTSPWRKSQWHSRRQECTSTLFKTLFKREARWFWIYPKRLRAWSR